MAGIIIDLNRITRPQFRQFIARLTADNTPEDKDKITAEMAARVITEWPFSNPITEDGVMSLGLLDGKAVDDALSAAILELNSKN